MPVRLPQLLLSIGICLGAGFIGSFFTYSAIPDWYAGLNKPPFNPPNWVFGPVWTLLYILMGISFYTIWISKSKFKKKGIKIFLIQLILNTSWSIAFFGFKNPELALINIIVLWIAIFLTIKSFLKISKVAAYLLIPYLLWVSFAGILNLSIVLLN
jgi:tryptophan-rich sensory protein